MAGADALAADAGGNTQPLGPVVPTIICAGGLRLSLFATIAQFGTPEDLTLDDLKIELFFPGDDDSDRALRQLALDDASASAPARPA